jgi:FkbM family methyltransferase
MSIGLLYIRLLTISERSDSRLLRHAPKRALGAVDVITEQSVIHAPTLTESRAVASNTSASRDEKGGKPLPLKALQRPILAICTCTRSLKTWHSLADSSLQTLLIPSIERYVTKEELDAWDVRLYLGIDHDDVFWLEHHERFEHPSWLTIDRGFYETPNHNVPFNEMMQHAYDDGAEYLVRINDDTEFVTSGWITRGVSALRAYDPPNLGVVGPTCKQGNTEIMTHDMVHRTHLEIFETYYPSVFSAWWVDDWITKVYQPGRSRQLKDWEVKHHTGKHGTRYNVQHSEGGLLKEEIAKGGKRVVKWLAGEMGNARSDKVSVWRSRASTADYCQCEHIVHHKCEGCTTHRVLSVPPVLHGKTLLIFGDSLPWQMAQLMKCVVGSDVTVVFKALHLFPIDEASFETFLTVVIKETQPDAIVFGIGTWYNWDWSVVNEEAVTAATTTRLLHEACPSTLLKTLETPYETTTDSYARALQIRTCKALLGSASYRSGLVRLKAILLRRWENWPPVFWKDVPPQHWKTPSGQYDWGGVGGRCVKIQNRTQAYERNRIANERLSAQTVTFIRTWEHDVDFWDGHVGKDCTHYCNPSKVPLNWVSATFKEVAAVLKRTTALKQGVGKALMPFRQISTNGIEDVPLTIAVLTMNRVESLRRLLMSLENTEYDNDRVHLVIRVDHATNNSAVVVLAKSFDFSHGEKTVHVATTNKGLRESWFDAWHPSTDESRGIILEDDVEVSPKWYAWLKAAWKTYGDRDDLAGISLQRQTLVPKNPSKQMEIVNDHVPFLYALVGSIGFSPHPKQWTAFLHWVATADLDRVSTPGLVTSDWYAQLDKRSMWTQAFIYFCKTHDLYTLYTNLPHKKTLGAHHREKGEHYGKTEGPDFALAQGVALDFPTKLVKYGWDGARREGIAKSVSRSMLQSQSERDVVSKTCWDAYQSNVDATKATEFVPGKSVMMEPSSVKMLCELLTPSTRVLEWGSGGSSLFFSKFVKSWDSVEHDAVWYTKMQDYSKSLVNVNVFTVAHTWDGFDDGTYGQFQEYVDLPKTFGKQFDVVIVDGRARPACARSVERNNLLAPNGVVVIHDWERAQYHVVLDTFRVYREDTTGQRHLGILRPRNKTTRAVRLRGLRNVGTEYGGWTYNATGLTPDSIVYSVGLGEDTSWDEGMMRDHGLHVWGFDPTPKSIAYVQNNEALGSHFLFTPEGLAIKQGTLTFTKPKNSNHVSMRAGTHGGLGPTVDVPVNTLEHWMATFGHSHVDILKLDIEGSEYDVLEDWIRRQWFPMDQLLVEFHQRFFEDPSRHVRVLQGLKENGFEIIHDVRGHGQEITFQRRSVSPQDVVPIVLMALNCQIGGHVPRHSIPFLCERNHKIVVLTNVKQKGLPNAGCLEVVDIGTSYQSSVTEMPWPTNAPGGQKVFFDRWYVLRDWMARTKTSRVFTMDSDAMLTVNVTEFVSLNVLELSKHDVWIVYNPPRSSWPFALLTDRALEDITSFWNRMFQADIWTSKFVGGTSPNDMIALGHYSHTAVGKPYPCWGYGPEHASGTCDNSIDYGHEKVLERLAQMGVRAKYPPGTLTLGPGGTAAFVEGVVDNNYRHDPMQRYEMRKGQKQLRFWRGQAQLKLRSQRWVTVWGYVLEDDTEACVKHHVEHIHKVHTCRCENWCCAECHPRDDCNGRRVFTWRFTGDTDCFQNDTTLTRNVFDATDAESQHSFNSYLWYSMQRYDCAVERIQNADWVFAINDFHSRPCQNKLRSRVQNSPEWRIFQHKHVIFLWDGFHNEWDSDAIQSSDDQLRGMVTTGLGARGGPCTDQAKCWQVGHSWGRDGLTSPYWYDASIRSPLVGPPRHLLVSGAWSNTRGTLKVRVLRQTLSQVVSSWVDTTLTSTAGPRRYKSETVVDMYSHSIFCAIPGGDSPSSRRLSTCIVNGAIPIICSDDFVPPWPHLDWGAFSIRIPEAVCGDYLQHLTYNVSYHRTMQQQLALVQHLFVMPANGQRSSTIVTALVDSIRVVRPLITTVQHAARLHAKHNVVVLQLLNEGYVEMTKSWICNVRRFGTVLSMTLFVTTDQVAYDALTAFDTTLHVVLEPYTAPKTMQYGQSTYYNYMLFRTKLITILLDSNLTLWLTESDAVWLKDPTNIVLETEGDMVTMSDDRPPRKLLQGGFQLLRPTDATKRVWTRMRDAFETKMKIVSKQEIGDHGSEQLMLDSMISKDAELRVGWLDPQKFVPGLWYKDTSYQKTLPAPAVILNNWIVGNDAKVARAKEWGHWFLEQNGGKCLTLTAKVS